MSSKQKALAFNFLQRTLESSSGAKKRKLCFKETQVDKWLLGEEQVLANLSIDKKGISEEADLTYRHRSAFLIQSIGQWLKVHQLTINTAIVYMHRFYVIRSFKKHDWKSVAAASLLLAGKSEDNARRLDHIVRVAIKLLKPHRSNYTDEYIRDQMKIVVIDESVLLQTLGFDALFVEHPHFFIIKAIQILKLTKELAKNAYNFATNTLILTRMCVQHNPRVVACLSIYAAAKGSHYKIPQSKTGLAWFHCIDKAVTADILAQLLAKYEEILKKIPDDMKAALAGYD